MTIRLRAAKLTALALVIALPLLGTTGVASAKATKASTPKCIKHPNSKKCLKAGGGTGSPGGGTGASSPQITVTVDPNPLVETGQSEIHAVVQVETLPSFAGDKVHIDSSQLSASCGTVVFSLIVPGAPSLEVLGRTDFAEPVLDDDGNATIIVDGSDCAPGTSVVEADLEVAPFLTALTTLVALP